MQHSNDAEIATLRQVVPFQANVIKDHDTQRYFPDTIRCEAHLYTPFRKLRQMLVNIWGSDMPLNPNPHLGAGSD